MPMHHTIGGMPAPVTQKTLDVLAGIAALVQMNRAHPVPVLLPFLREGLVRYQREPRRVDQYLTWWQVLETSPAVSAWRRRWGLSWMDIANSPERLAKVLKLLKRSPAKADCEDLAAWLVAELGRGWPVVQEFRDTWGTLTGWHAMGVVEVSEGAIHPGEVPRGGSLYVLHFPEPAQPMPGMRLALVDPAWMAGMKRPTEGPFDWARVSAR